MATKQEQTIDLSDILNSSHENKWVAIAADYSRVIAASNSLRELMKSVPDTSAIFHRVLSRDLNFAPATT